MKKIFSLLYIVVTAVCAHGQVMVNGDFSNNAGNITRTFQCPSHSSSTFFYSDVINSVLNWRIAHGNPTFNTSVTPGLPHFYPNAILMHDFAGAGDGIHGDYPFIAGQSYIIHLGVDAIMHADKIRLVATNIMPSPDINSCKPTCGDPRPKGGVGGDPIVPSGFPPDADKEEIVVPLLLVGDNKIVYTPSHNYNHIMIFPFDPTTCYPDLVDILLHYVWIYPDCKETVYIPASGTPTPSFPLRGGYTDSRHLYAGSKYGTTLSIPVIVHTNRITDFKATKQITLSDNFVAAVNSGNYFLAEIDPNTCGQLPSYIQLDNTIYGKRAPPGDPIVNHWNTFSIGQSGEENVNYRFTLSPSPNNGTFDITLPNTESSDITISNTVGSIIYQTKVSGGNKHTIKMQDTAPGNYFVTITNGQFKEVKKMVIVK